MFLLVGTCGAYLLVTMLPLMMMLVVMMQLDDIGIVGDGKKGDKLNFPNG